MENGQDKVIKYHGITRGPGSEVMDSEGGGGGGAVLQSKVGPWTSKKGNTLIMMQCS